MREALLPPWSIIPVQWDGEEDEVHSVSVKDKERGGAKGKGWERESMRLKYGLPPSRPLRGYCRCGITAWLVCLALLAVGSVSGWLYYQSTVAEDVGPLSMVVTLPPSPLAIEIYNPTRVSVTTETIAEGEMSVHVKATAAEGSGATPACEHTSGDNMQFRGFGVGTHISCQTSDQEAGLEVEVTVSVPLYSMSFPYYDLHLSLHDADADTVTVSDLSCRALAITATGTIEHLLVENVEVDYVSINESVFRDELLDSNIVRFSALDVDCSTRFRAHVPAGVVTVDGVECPDLDMYLYSDSASVTYTGSGDTGSLVNVVYPTIKTSLFDTAGVYEGGGLDAGYGMVKSGTASVATAPDVTVSDGAEMYWDWSCGASGDMCLYGAIVNCESVSECMTQGTATFRLMDDSLVILGTE
ncbi:hypothetical protein KIPB_003625 [Kipferlia bialata]|uniref:Uncharacterized protein n=1 Tax=Kipferlia bialata TaxID=797122 RepID=A0A9K3CUC5_9EUKA|nr:hypothetical protein KIPB_003625 [Kipferlia bialata]|eukprot:g3625.t1